MRRRRTFSVAAMALAGWVLAVWIASLVYAAVTFWWSQRFVPHRGRRDVLRSFLGEMRSMLWTQPLMPVYQVAHRRMGTGGGEVPIVLVHGYFQNRVDFTYLAKRLRAAGSGPLFAFNFNWLGHLEPAEERLERFVESVLAETGAPQVDLLTHSCGGLLALRMAERRPELVRRLALIAVPYGGVTWRGPVLGASARQLRSDSAYIGALTASAPGETSAIAPVLSIYSVHDNLVHPVAASQVRGAHVTWREFEGLGHITLLFDPAVADAVCEFLLGYQL